MKKDMPLNDSVASIKPAKRTQVSQEFISAKEKYAPKEEKKEEIKVEKPKLVIKDNTKKEKKDMPKTSATKVMGIEDILEVKAKQNKGKAPVKKVSKKSSMSSDALMLRVCFVILAFAIISIIFVLLFN